MNAPAKTLLRIVSLLMIVASVILAILNLFTILGVMSLVGNYSYLGGSVLLAGVLVIAWRVIEISIGIAGLKKSSDPGKSSFFIISGSILLVLAVLFMIISFDPLQLVSIVFPVLYIVGGIMNSTAKPQ